MHEPDKCFTFVSKVCALLQWFKNTAHTLLTAHVLISCTAVALALETNIVLQQPFQPMAVYAFIFTTTFFAYNIYYIKTDRAAFYRPLAAISFTACVAILFYLPRMATFRFLLIGIAAVIYIFPLFFSFKKDKSFTVQKLLLLILIWSATTFLIPIGYQQYDIKFLLLLIYRIVFISTSCLLFFIRDEKVDRFRIQAISANYICAFVQIVLSLLILFVVPDSTGWVYLFISVLGLWLVRRFLQHRYPAVYYLAFADGILLLQAMIILTLYCLR